MKQKTERTMKDDSLVAAELAGVQPSPAYPPAPELGDVIDALDDAAATFKVVVRNQARSVFEEMRNFVRDQPLVALALAGGVAFLFGRLRR